MISRSRELFAKLERQKEAMLSELALWPEDRLSFRPTRSAWSAREILDHLVKVEQQFLSAVKQQLPNGQRISWDDRIRALFVTSIMKSPVRLQVPAAALTVLPEPSPDPSKIFRQWSAVRTETADLLQSLHPKQLRCGVFRHPMAG